MCIYPMDSPGGYQLVGRTLPIWNTFGRTGPFTAHKPWLLEFFDQVTTGRLSAYMMSNICAKDASHGRRALRSASPGCSSASTR